MSALLPSQTLHRRLVLALYVFLVLLGLLLALMPFGIQLGIERTLLSLGARQASVQDVDFNPFTGKLKITSLRAMGAKPPALIVDEARAQLSWSALWQRRISLERIRLKGLRLDLRQTSASQFSLAGMVFPPQAPPEPATRPAPASGPPWGFGIQRLTLEDIDFAYQGEKLALETHVDELQLATLQSWDSAATATLTLAGRINGAPLNLHLDATPFAETRRVKGRLQLEHLDLAAFAQLLPPALEGLQGQQTVDASFDASLDAASNLKLTLNGRTDSTGFALQLPQQQLALGHESLSWQGNVMLEHGAQQTALELEGELKQRNLDLTRQQTQAHSAELQWQGATRLLIKENHTDLAVQGQLDNGRLRITQPTLQAGYDHLRWMGTVKLRQDPQHSTWSVDGDLSNDHLVVSRQGAEKTQPLLETKTLKVAGIHVNQAPEVNVDTILLDTVKVHLTRDKAGNMLLPGANPEGKPAEPAATAVPATAPQEKHKGPAAIVRIQRIQVGGDSEIGFDDQRVTPRFQLAMQLKEVLITGMDSTRPQQSAALNIAGKLGQYSTFDLNGQVFPFAAKPSFTVTGDIKALDLPPLSSYTNAALGYNLASGHLNAKLDVKVDQGVINSENQLTFKQLKLEPSDPDKMEKFSKKLTMPLDTALSLLRDKNDNIKLKLPISGDINNPDFSIADAINQSLGKAMNFAAMYYLKLALQPYGTLITLYQAAGTAGKMINGIRLDPVKFPANDNRLDNEDRDYLATTLKLLDSRPKMNLKICAKATVDDLQALRLQLRKQTPATTAKPPEPPGATPGASPSATPGEKPTPQEQEKLLSLARQRGDVIKRYLVEGGADPGRLFLCNPEIDQDKDAKPRAELLI